MKRILVTSSNPVKIEATKIGFDRLFPEEQFECIGMSVPSGVAAQPLCDGETLQGAQNRVSYAREADTTADFYVGIEGGLEKRPEGYLVVDWVVIENKAGQRGQGKMNAFYLPPAMAELINAGMELGEATDKIFNTANIKTQESGIGLLTANTIPRTDYLVFAITLALIPFKNPDLYTGK